VTIFSWVHAIIQVPLQILSLKHNSVVDQLNLLLPADHLDLLGNHCVRDIFNFNVIVHLWWRDHCVD